MVNGILIIGRTQEESDKNVDSVFKRLADNGLTVNEDKCFFNQSEITFFGFRFTANGVSLSTLKM